MRIKRSMKIKGLPFVIAAGLMAGSAGQAAEVYLRAGAVTNTLPNGQPVVMWGFAQDSAFEALDGTITVPGPALDIPPNDNSLIIHLDNDLPEPVSVVIPGLIAADSPVPVREPDGRAFSFTDETPPGNTLPVDYRWDWIRSGTFVYHSGSHISVQVQMGLFGGLKKDSDYGEAYPGISYNSDVLFILSEVDTVLHAAVASGNFGAGKAMTSTSGYLPKYFMINGVSFTNGLPGIPAGRPGDRILIRLINAGMESRVPLLDGTYVTLVAEDGYPMPYSRDAYAMWMPPMKTMDGFVVADGTNHFALYDRRLALVNNLTSPGGMMTSLAVMNSAPVTNIPPEWIVAQFGVGPYASNTVGYADDPDMDGMNNYNEYIAGTDPNDPFSLLYISNLNPTNQPHGPVVTFDGYR